MGAGTQIATGVNFAVAFGKRTPRGLEYEYCTRLDHLITVESDMIVEINSAGRSSWGRQPKHRD